MKTLFLTLIFVSSAALADDDKFEFTRGKQLHVAGSAFLGAAATMAYGKPNEFLVPFAIGLAPGIAKEIYDRHHRQESYKSMARDVAIDAIGVAAGVYAANKYLIYVSKKDGAVTLNVAAQF